MGYDIPADHHGSLPRTAEQQQKYWPTRPLSFQEVIQQSIERAKRWHGGSIESWTPLEWAGAMCGEAGEAANAAKKLKRVMDGLQTINESARHLPTIEVASQAVVKEVADTILYAVLVAASVGYDETKFVAVLREVFNKKSEEYGFPERL